MEVSLRRLGEPELWHLLELWSVQQFPMVVRTPGTSTTHSGLGLESPLSRWYNGLGLLTGAYYCVVDVLDTCGQRVVCAV